MRLYLESKSEKNIGYTPDWIKVTYKDNGNYMELTFDIQGDIDYNPNTLSCRCKGELIPWVLYDCETGDEIDFEMLSETEIETILPVHKIAELICNSNTYEIGIYPVDSDIDEVFEMAEKDILSNCKGRFEMYVDEDHYYTKDFKFEVELNIY